MNMRGFTKLLFIALCLMKSIFCSSDVLKPKIAIVGAGIGGASTSHFLTELLDGNLEIDIFESKEIGGRLATVQVAGNVYEAGGSVLDPHNKYMADFVKLLGLEERPISKETKTGVWNGEVYVFNDSKRQILAMTDQLFNHVNSVLDSFKNIYKNQDDGEAYDTVVDLISSMSPEISKLLQISTEEHFYSLEFSNEITDQLVKAILIGDFGQDTEVHSFLGCLSVAVQGSDLWAVTGGNQKIPAQLIHRNSKVNVVPSQVTAIRYLYNDETQLPQYELSYNKSGSNYVDIYDIVVIAAPLTWDQEHQIAFVGFPENYNPPSQGNYETTTTTFVEGDLDLIHFGLEESIDAILSTNPNETEIYSVGKLFPVDGPIRNDSRVWKVFSGEPLTSSQIDSIFSQVDQVQDVRWKAYPKYSTDARSDKFELYDSLYHVNAIEWAASAMEMSAIAGRNVALLVDKKLASCCKDSVTENQRCKYLCKGQNVPDDAPHVEL